MRLGPLADRPERSEPYNIISNNIITDPIIANANPRVKQPNSQFCALSLDDAHGAEASDHPGEAGVVDDGHHLDHVFILSDY